MHNVLSIILGGGRGTRLYPLTKLRAKPALPLAGRYRLIDIPVSNCINSGIQTIFVLTQFNSASLNRHIANTYQFSPFANGFVQVLAAQQTNESPGWFQGTADAVRKTLWVLDPYKVRDYLILSGDHLYRMDYRPFIERHRSTDADVTISVLPVDETKASSFGLLKIDGKGRVIDFSEKPSGENLFSMKVDTRILGLDEKEAVRTPYIASMGIYMFKHEALIEMLKENGEHNDFGKHVIPASLKDFHVQAYLFRGYWEDIGTVESFYHANLQLVKQPDPLFSFYDRDFPIYSRPRFLPPTKIKDCAVENSMVCEGSIIRNSRIRNSIIGIRSRLEENTVVEDTLMMGSDFFQSDEERLADIAAGLPPIGIGANSIIRHAIIDKNARVGKNVKIINRDKVQNIDRESIGYSICSGIVVILKNARIPDDTEI